MTTGFRWQDGERLVRFGRGALADAPELLGAGFTLLTTERAAAAAPGVAGLAGRTLVVGPGRVDALAGDLVADVDGEDVLVALGGGRVVDTGKALVAAGRARRVAAVPTTLSAAEMTHGHRRARGTAADAPGVRPALVLNDPALSASQPVAGLAASTANALGHAVEGPLTPLASPVPVLAALEAARLLAAGWRGPAPDRDALALGALLAGFAIDSTHYGLHHVLSQTLVREAGVGHGPANAALLPHTAAALRRRAPDGLAALERALGDALPTLAAGLAARAGARRLRDLGVDEATLDRCADAAARRPDLALTPPPADRAELRALYAAAF